MTHLDKVIWSVIVAFFLIGVAINVIAYKLCTINERLDKLERLIVK